MKGHVAGALRWRDFPLALWLRLRHGEAGSLEQFKTAFAASLNVPPQGLQLFDSGRSALHAFAAC